jgi:hypothetical protein
LCLRRRNQASRDYRSTKLIMIRRSAIQPTLMTLDHTGRQLVPGAIEGVAANTVLESRDRRLRRQRIPVDWIAVEEQLLDRTVRIAVLRT